MPEQHSTSAPLLKLGSTLSQLIHARGFNRGRKKIAAAVGVSPSALHQYERSLATPSLPVAVKLAAFFNVSLDYLILGEDRSPPEEVNESPFYRYFDASITDVKESVVRQSWMMSRLGDVLSQKINEVADAMCSQSNAHQLIPGLITDDILYRLEAFSHSTFIGTDDFSYTFSLNRGTGQAGKFFPIILRNISRGWPYRFLLRPGFVLQSVIASFRVELSSRINNVKFVADNCKISEASHDFISHYCHYKLHMPELTKSDPLLYQLIEAFVGDEGDLCYVNLPNSAINAAILVDRRSIPGFVKYIDAAWAEATAI